MNMIGGMMRRLSGRIALWRSLPGSRHGGDGAISRQPLPAPAWKREPVYRVPVHRNASSVIQAMAASIMLALCLFSHAGLAEAQDNIPHAIRYQITTGVNPVPKFRNHCVREQYKLIMKKGMREKCMRLSEEASKLQKKIMKFVNGKLNPKFDEWKHYQKKTEAIGEYYAYVGNEWKAKQKHRKKIAEQLQKEWESLYKQYLKQQKEYERKRQIADKCWKDALRQAEANCRTVERKSPKDFSKTPEDISIRGLKGCPECQESINQAKKYEEIYYELINKWNVKQLKESIRKAKLLLQTGLTLSEVGKGSRENTSKDLRTFDQQRKENKALEKKIEKWQNVLDKIEKARKDMEATFSIAKSCIKVFCGAQPVLQGDVDDCIEIPTDQDFRKLEKYIKARKDKNCEYNIVWTAQADQESSALTSGVPEIGLEDQWGIKAINWDPSLVPSQGSVVVAVIDSGVDYHNEQIMDAIWKNPKETLNGKDDDGNGYIDDIIGWNFFADNNDPWDDYGHGTMVAGIIAARPINNKGIFGVNPRAKIMNLKVIDEAGNTGTHDVARAIYYAVHHGANVINLSLGEKIPSLLVDIAIAYAYKKGAIVIVASGNEAMDTSEYSSGSMADKTITVAAINNENKRMGVSNWGQEVDIAAPGTDVLSLRSKGTDMLKTTGSVAYVIGDKEHWPWKHKKIDSDVKGYISGKNIVKKEYYHATGTSFAAPFVSGVASLIMMQNPNLTNEQVERMILYSADDIEDKGWDKLTGYGRLNAKKALQADPDYFTIARVDKIAPARKDGKLVIQVFGSAASSEFKKAWVELGFGEKPEKWKKVGKIKKEVKENILTEIPSKEFTKKGKWSVRVVVKTQKHGNKEGWGSMDIQ